MGGPLQSLAERMIVCNNYKHEHTGLVALQKTIEVTFSCLPIITPTMPHPTPIDAYPTETSNLQGETEKVLQGQVPFDGSGSDSGGYVLNKKGHIEFLVRNLVQGFPARYMSQDASQPWLMYWTLQSLSAIQVAIDPNSKQRCLT
jgi:protein farnesyltransferase subunit beta